MRSSILIRGKWQTLSTGDTTTVNHWCGWCCAHLSCGWPTIASIPRHASRSALQHLAGGLVAATPCSRMHRDASDGARLIDA